MPSQVLNRSKEAIIFLLQHGFIKSQSNESNQTILIPTPLGKATSLSGISPKDAVTVIKSLEAAKSKLIIKSGLHAVFLVTPPSSPLEPKWEVYYDIIETFYQEHPVRNFRFIIHKL
jgi:hypothetical protein